jgi:hypothetical protein
MGSGTRWSNGPRPELSFAIVSIPFGPFRFNGWVSSVVLRGLVIFAGVLIVIIVVVGAPKKRNRKALAALPDVPLKCPKCGSEQVHAGGRDVIGRAAIGDEWDVR